MKSEISNYSFKIGSVPVKGDLILAPMDGITDSPFRLIARQSGSALSYSEFINAVDIEQKNPNLTKRLRFNPEERPFVFQLLDNSPERIERAANYLMNYQPDIFDINLGCCAKTVAGRGAGAGLLREPEKILQIFTRLIPLGIPITAKIRLGWDETSLNYLDIARLLEQNGCSLIAVHGRTRQQFYSGEVNWEAIGCIKQSVKIPVIGNGDVKTLEDIDKMKEFTRCDGVMIGRASIGNPWIFSRVDRKTIMPEMLEDMILKHLGLMMDFYGDPSGLVLFRKHANAYIQPYNVEVGLRRELLTCLTRERFADNLQKILYR